MSFWQLKSLLAAPAASAPVDSSAQADTSAPEEGEIQEAVTSVAVPSETVTEVAPNVVTEEVQPQPQIAVQSTPVDSISDAEEGEIKEDPPAEAQVSVIQVDQGTLKPSAAMDLEDGEVLEEGEVPEQGMDQQLVEIVCDLLRLQAPSPSRTETPKSERKRVKSSKTPGSGQKRKRVRHPDLKSIEEGMEVAPKNSKGRVIDTDGPVTEEVSTAADAKRQKMGREEGMANLADLEALRVQALKTLKKMDQKKKKDEVGTEKSEEPTPAAVDASEGPSLLEDIEALRSSVLQSMKGKAGAKKTRKSKSTAETVEETKESIAPPQQEKPQPSIAVTQPPKQEKVAPSTATLAQWFNATFTAPPRPNEVPDRRKSSLLTIQTQRLVIDFSKDDSGDNENRLQASSKLGDSKADSLHEAIQKIKKRIALMEQKRVTNDASRQSPPSRSQSPTLSTTSAGAADEQAGETSSGSSSSKGDSVSLSKLLEREVALKVELKAARSRVSGATSTCKSGEHSLAVAESALAGYKRLQAQHERNFFEKRNLYDELVKTLQIATKNCDLIKRSLAVVEKRVRSDTSGVRSGRSVYRSGKISVGDILFERRKRGVWGSVRIVKDTRLCFFPFFAALLLRC